MKKSIAKLKGINTKIDKPIILTFLVIFISIFEFNAIEVFVKSMTVQKLKQVFLKMKSYQKSSNQNSNDSKSIVILSFEGKKLSQSNELKWQISSGFGIDFFTIEKSTDGHLFEVVGIKVCNENSNHLLEYELIDDNVKNEINYYRIKQTYFDGSFEYSEMISVDNSIDRSIKEINTIVNLLGQEVNEYYRGIVVIEYSDGTLVKAIQ